jgi:hypothetical protein
VHDCRQFALWPEIRPVTEGFTSPARTLPISASQIRFATYHNFRNARACGFAVGGGATPMPAYPFILDRSVKEQGSTCLILRDHSFATVNPGKEVNRIHVFAVRVRARLC